MKILISRTDNIGDVILTLPLCGWLKRHIQDSEVHFLAKDLTIPILERCTHIDKIHLWDGDLPQVDCIIHVFPNKQVAKKARERGIRIRVGTSHRNFHLFTCNRLVNFTRIKSELHEAQLNFKLLRGLGHKLVPEFRDLSTLSGWMKPRRPPIDLAEDKFNLIFHIKSRGSAKEWASQNYLALAQQLSESFNIILTGVKKEAQMIKEEIPQIFDLSNVTDTTGKLSLTQLIDLIGCCDGLLACSTGPLHIAGVNNIHCLGLFPKDKPMHAGRWKPLGLRSKILEEETASDEKLLSIDTTSVMSIIKAWEKPEVK